MTRCPSCGYCPHCGNRNPTPWRYPNTYPWGYPPNYSGGWTTTSQSHSSTPKTQTMQNCSH